MKKKITIISVILIIIGIICFWLYQVDGIRFKISYEYINQFEYNNGKKIKVSIPWDNQIKYLEDDKVINFLNTETGIVYFGYNDCPWCRNIVEPLLEVAKEENIDTIYYVNTHNIKSITNDLYKVLNSYLKTNPETNKKRLAVPDVYFIKNGKIMMHHIGTVDSYKNPYLGMNKKQIEELKAIYRKGIEMIK